MNRKHSLHQQPLTPHLSDLSQCTNVDHSLLQRREPMSPEAQINATNNTEPLYPNEGIRVLQMIVTVLIFTVGVSLNALVVWALGIRVWCRQKSTLNETQSADSFRIYVVNLAIADLVLLSRTPIMLTYLANDFNWKLGEPTCKLVIYLRCLGLYASAFLLCAVAVERCLCLLRPVWARLKRPRWAVFLTCGAIWVLAVAFASPYITTAQIVIWQNHANCIERDSEGQALTVVETVVGFLLPLFIFLSCNIAVVFCAKKAESAMSSPTTGQGATSHRLIRLYRVLFLTMLLFLTCWVPYFTCRFLKALALSKGWDNLKQKAMAGSYVALFLVYIKSALNPIMYVFAARGLSRTLRTSLISTIERVFNDELSESIRRKSLRRKDSQY